MEECFRCVVQ